MKSKLLKVVMIINLCLITLFTTYLIISWINYNKEPEPEEEDNEPRVAEFQNIKYTIPAGYTFTPDPENENLFILATSSGYDWVHVEIVDYDAPDEDLTTYRNVDELYDIIIENGYDVYEPEMIEVEGESISSLKYRTENGYIGLVAYVIHDEKYVYELTIYNDNNNHEDSLNYLEVVYDILNTAEY